MKIGSGIEEKGSINALSEEDAAEEFSSRESVQRSSQKWIHLNIRLLHMRVFASGQARAGNQAVWFVTWRSFEHLMPVLYPNP